MQQSSEIDSAKLGQFVKNKRGERGLREVAGEIGEISPSTLSRIENGRLPDLDTYLRLCRWLGRSPSFFALDVEDVGSQDDVLETPERIAVTLRAERKLDRKTIDAIVTMVRLAYEAAENDDLESEPD